MILGLNLGCSLWCTLVGRKTIMMNTVSTTLFQSKKKLRCLEASVEWNGEHLSIKVSLKKFKVFFF